ncbi:hypothetical protein LCGC14_2991400 [marine sediment metagenome]|uniref:AP2/ERF domain-containing protein n=1 Tax=marine sediment metagenome TaxID=412755 RepID=A0A0F8ZUS0_9ZZZZ
MNKEQQVEVIDLLEQNMSFMQEGIEHLEYREVLQVVKKNTKQVLALLKQPECDTCGGMKKVSRCCSKLLQMTLDGWQCSQCETYCNDCRVCPDCQKPSESPPTSKEKTAPIIKPETRVKKGEVAGQPPVISMAVAVDDCDIQTKPPVREPTKLIPLTQGKYTIVDEKNYDMLSKHTWYAKCECGIWYAVREIRDAEGKRTTQRMHRYILNCPKGKDVDHKNHNGLDNRESNIRICTNSQNQQNQRPCRGGSSKYKGVSFRKDTNRWTAHIKNGGKLINLGNYGTEIEAAKIYDEVAKKHFREFARTNF